MNTVRFADPTSFLARAGPWLLSAEVENNVIYSIAASIADRLLVPKQAPYFAAAVEADQVVACALRTPPHKLLISSGPDTAMHALTQDVFSLAPDLPAMDGPEPAAGVFAAAWSKMAGCTARIGTRRRLYATRAVERDLPHVVGVLRNAELHERPLAVEWANAFALEAMPNEHFDQEEAIDRAFRLNALYFWDDAGAVSMVAARGTTSNSARVGHVYTPKNARRRGYATAAVAALTGRLLAQGIGWCCLYTNLANPTSNSIYQQIGYRPVRDFNDYLFAP